MATNSTALKRQRAAQKAFNKAPADALLALGSALQNVGIRMDRFCKTYDGDPLNMDPRTLHSVDLEKQKVIVFFADREDSQTLHNRSIKFVCLLKAQPSNIICVKKGRISDL